MIIAYAANKNLLDQLNHLENFADHVKPVMVMYNEDNKDQITSEITGRYKVLETPIIKSGAFIIIQKEDLTKELCKEYYDMANAQD